MDKTTQPKAASFGWGSNMFNGAREPSIYWGARTIFHPGSVEYKKKGYKLNRKGKIVRQWKNGPPEWDCEEIRTKAYLDFLPDRSGWSGFIWETEGFEKLRIRSEYLSFREWLEKSAMPELNKWIQWQSSSSGDVLEVNHNNGQYHLRASPNASYGYVYIAAWRD